MNWRLIPKFRARNATSWDLLKAVIAAIKEEPRRIYMDNWVRDLATAGRWEMPPENLQPACGTQGCIAGWMKIMTAPNKAVAVDKHNTETVALALLPESLRDDAYELFHGKTQPYTDSVGSKYPFPAGPEYNSLRDQRRYAKEVIQNIKAFMKEHKVALKANVIDRKAAHAATL